MDTALGRHEDVNNILEEELKASLVDGKLHCAAALGIARKLKLNPKKVGDAANRLNIKIASCQLGCFP